MIAEWTALEDVLKIIEENKIQSDYVQNDKNFKSNLHWKGEKIELENKELYEELKRNISRRYEEILNLRNGIVEAITHIWAPTNHASCF